MLISIATPISILLASAAAAEVHGGITYEVRFDAGAEPQEAPIKDEYEAAAAKQALDRLTEQIGATGIASDCLESSKGEDDIGTLYALKDCIAGEDPNAFFDLLGPDVSEANTFWDTVVEQSNTDRTTWKAAKAYVKCYFDGKLNAAQFAIWTQSEAADAANLHANPEHYFKKTTVTGLSSQRSDIFEGWGGVMSKLGTKRTNFTVPEYTTPKFGTDEYPEAWAIDDKFTLLLQRIGPKVLEGGNGNTFGVLHIAVRDFLDEGGPANAGIEIYSAVWYPSWDGASEEDHTEFTERYLSDEAHHMVVEVINLTQQAQKDCATGLCVEPTE